jgi:hypothetical protein
VALLMTLFVVLIVAAVILQLTVTTSSEYAVSGNEGVLARLDAAADAALVDARKALIDDAQQSQDSGDGSGGGGGALMPGVAPSGDPGGAGGGQGAASADTLNDGWAHDQETSMADVQVRVHIEDENRKFNILSLVAKDQEFAKASRERLVRIIDMMREFNGSAKDIDSSYAETIAANIQAWLEGNRRNFDRPNLHSNKPDTTTTLPLTLDELLLVDGIDEDVFYDQKVGNLVYPGLESVLTVWTSLEAGAIKNDETSSGTDPGTSGSTTPPGNTAGNSNTTGNPTDPSSSGADESKVNDPAVAGGKTQGVKININTAPPCVLRALMPNFDISTDVWDAIIRYRNQIDEEKLKKARESGDYTGGEFPPGVDPATKVVDRSSYVQGEGGPSTQIFSSLDDLNKIDEWKNLANDNAKKEVLKLLTTKSEVFSIYITARPSTGRGALQGPSVDAFGVSTTAPGQTDADDTPGGIVKRIRQVVWRRTSQSETVLLPLIVREERHVRKVQVPEFPVDAKSGQPIFR